MPDASIISAPVLGISGKYVLDARLGGGGMAEVFAGSTVGAEGFSRKVAIKRVLPGFSDNPAFAQMFVAEAQITSRMVHPNIVSVLDFDRDGENRLFLVMEMIDGRDLDALMSAGVLLPVPLVIYIISEVLRGLGYAHDLPVGTDVRGVIHRDVSPHNVLLSWEGAVKVSDFGIAKARAASEATASVFIKGKPAYMSPEQANGQPLDGRSDLFAVGIMLWEMLIGRRLFIGEDTRSTLATVLFGQVPRPRSLRGEVPKDLERVTMKLLERDLPARYATAELAVADLLECENAPKNGRELLTQMLTERFPDLAPVRQSVLRARERSGPKFAAPPASAEAGTVRETPGRGVPKAALPSLGAARAAPTGTAGPSMSAMVEVARPKRRLGRVFVIAAAVAIGLGAASFALVSSATKRGDQVAVGSAAASPVAHSVAQPTPIDAGMAPADAPAPTPPPPPAPIDAGVADAAALHPQKDASSAQPAHPAVEKRTGRLRVDAFPVLTVYVDSRKVGDTPFPPIMLPVGKHALRLVNNENGIDEHLAITITDGQETLINRVH